MGNDKEISIPVSKIPIVQKKGTKYTFKKKDVLALGSVMAMADQNKPISYLDDEDYLMVNKDEWIAKEYLTEIEKVTLPNGQEITFYEALNVHGKVIMQIGNYAQWILLGRM